MGKHIAVVDEGIKALDGELAALHETNAISQLLATIPGVGPLGAITMALSVDLKDFTPSGGISQRGWG